MLEFIQKLFSSDFMPHGMCYFWDPKVLWLNVSADAVIALCYYAIPFLLFRFARQRRDITFKWIFVAFGMFILACGTTHVIGVITVWNPVYRLEGAVKLVTALASVATLAMLVPLLPTLVGIPTSDQLKGVNRLLAAEIEERRAAEEQVRQINEDLEERVARRTAERRALQDQLNQSQKLEAVGRLAGGVAHDFNNLLTVILGYNEMLREQVAQDPVALDFAEEVQRAAERASALTNQLLALSRRQVAVPRLLDLNDVVRQMDRMLHRLIGEDIILETRLAASLAPVKVDPTHIDQVILNLSINSRDAMPRGGTLIIETADVDLLANNAGHHIGVGPGRYVMLAVSDTGTGMDEGTLARIFEPFFSTKEQGKGTGLGLSIVHGIVKQNDGEIMVYSEPGRGTSFKIYLPASPGQAEVPVRPAIAATPAGGGETILLVEDEAQLRELAHMMLKRLGYQVILAQNLAEAVELSAGFSGHIHLLLTDVVMPGGSGSDLAREITAARPGIPVLYMSGYTDNIIVLQGILRAETPFLQKPFTAENLQRKVREVLG
ncbi:MAG TPA: ATP-binding protein [Candidatus Acidoferrum sp.]|nr:ATP-binding protein [Candidatus Acidoferrum sp.]